MRLFAAIRFSPAVEEALWAAVGDLRCRGAGTFTRRENLHLTLAFIGETDRLAEVKAALAALAGSGPVSLEAGGPLGRFGDLWWAGIRGGPALEALAGAAQTALRAAGFPIERRAWRPHVTLVRRWRGPVPETQVAPAAMTAERISLMRSDRVDGRLIYTEVFSVRL